MVPLSFILRSQSKGDPGPQGHTRKYPTDPLITHKPVSWKTLPGNVLTGGGTDRKVLVSSLSSVLVLAKAGWSHINNCWTESSLTFVNWEDYHMRRQSKYSTRTLTQVKGKTQRKCCTPPPAPRSWSVWRLRWSLTPSRAFFFWSWRRIRLIEQ